VLTCVDEQAVASVVQDWTGIPVGRMVKNEIDNVIYEKPLPIKLQLMTLILERFIGRQLDISDFSFFTNNKKINNNFELLNQAFSATNTELIAIDGQSFQQGDILSVEQWTVSKQQLNYQVQGKLNINEQELSLNYNFALSSERTSYSKVEMSAVALKDPLIVQFGAQGLGEIKGQKNFKINQDNKIDQLPIFSGDVGYLVYDQNNNQQADNGSELFGPKTGQGFAELALLDSNKNGFIDADDEQFDQLYLWQPSDDNNQAEQWGEDLSVVAEVFENADFAALMKHANMPAADKLAATATVLAGVNPLVRNLVDLLIAKNSVDAIAGVYFSYTEFLDSHLGRQRVEITTAVPLESAETERINSFVSGLVRREVVLTAKVDESIIGGLVIQIGDRLLDGSTKARLDGLRNRLHTQIAASA